MREQEYFRLVQKEHMTIQKKSSDIQEDVVIYQVEDTGILKEIDYLEAEDVISDRLKLLLEPFLPKKLWKPHVFIDVGRKEQEVYWELELKQYVPDEEFRNKDGIIFQVVFKEKKIPRICAVAPEKGARMVILDLSVLESMLRRGIRGVKWESMIVYLAEAEMGS